MDAHDACNIRIACVHAADMRSARSLVTDKVVFFKEESVVALWVCPSSASSCIGTAPKERRYASAPSSLRRAILLPRDSKSSLLGIGEKQPPLM